MDLHPFRQRSFRQRASIEGVGLHSGAKVRLTLAPASADSGIVFIRDGYTCQYCGTNAKELTIDHVVPKRLGGGATWENLVCCCRRCNTKKGDKLARLSPARGRFSINYTIDFRHPLISDQSYRVDLTEKSFQKDIARARTFGFKRDVERLHKAGLARGGSLENAVVVDDFNILNPEGLRFSDEFVRHKILDALGDLSLIGMPVIGQLTAVKSGHALNHQLVRRVLAEAEACEVVQPSAEDELHEIQERLLPVLALEEQVA